MTPDEAIKKARWYEREDIATTLREEANVLAAECERLRACMAKAGLAAFMRDGSPEAVAEHLRSVIDSYEKPVAECQRLRERVARLEEALVHISIQDGEELIPLADHAAHTLADGLRHCGEVARAALKGTP